MELNILRIDVDRSHRVFSTSNLSLNQCSNNNQIRVYCEGEYSFIQMSFRKPDGWLSDKVKLSGPVSDEEGYKYYYYDVDVELISFIMGGRNAILQANLYFNIRLSVTEYQTATAGNIRINVNYVDDALVNTNYSQAYINNLNANIGRVENELYRFAQGDIEVGSAIMDQNGNVIDFHYETKSDADQKFNTLNERKLDRSEVQDQTQRLEAAETNISTTNIAVNTLQSELSNTKNTADLNKSNIELLKNTTVSETEFNEALEARKAAENKLQSQIDSLQQSSVFKDMVDTVSKLNSYDKSKLVEGDRILVLSDSIIYRWNGTDFERVGKYGSATYTKAEIDSQHNTITNTIPNKSTLNDGKLVLSKGNTPISITDVKLKTVNNESIWGEGNIVIPVDTEFSQTSTNPVENRLITNAILQKADEVRVEELSRELENKADKTELEAKQNKLTAGNNITIDDDGRISVNGLISLQLIPEDKSLDDYRPGLTNVIYIYKPDNETGYSEYLWVEEKQDFEPFGEAGIHLENYYTIKQIEELLAKKANLEFVNNIDVRVSQNAADIATKADREPTNTAIGNLSASVVNLQSAVATKADKTVVDTLPTREEFDSLSLTVDSKQDLLKSGENIKKIRTSEGVYDVLGSGELFITSATITDLGLYYTKEELDPKLATKADKSEIIKDFELLENKPDLSVYRLNNDSYSKTEVDNALRDLQIEDKLGNYYNKEEVDAQIEAIDLTDDLKDYAKTEYVDAEVKKVDDKFASYVTKDFASTTYISQTTALEYATKDDLAREINQIHAPVDKTSQLINDSGFITKFDLPKDLNEFTNGPGYLTTETPAFKNKQDKLVAGTNIKTINNKSILGTGNIEIITDVFHLEEKKDAADKLKEAKAYSDANKSALQVSISANTNSIASLTTAVNTEKENRIGAVARLEGLITANDTDITNLQSGLSTEIAERKAADTKVLADAKAYVDSALGGEDGILEAIEAIRDQLGEGAVDIMASINQNKSDIAGVRKDLTDNTNTINTNLSAVQTQSNTNKTNIANLTTALEKEVSERKAADNTLTDSVNTNTTNISTLTTNLSNEATTRESADTALSTRITDLNTAFEGHKTSANDKMGELNTAIAAETEARQAEDENIYSVIETFTGQTDIKIKGIQSNVNDLNTRLTEAQKSIDDHKKDADSKFTTLTENIGMKILFVDYTK